MTSIKKTLPKERLKTSENLVDACLLDLLAPTNTDEFHKTTKEDREGRTSNEDNVEIVPQRQQ
jgi:hypothetical protein